MHRLSEDVFQIAVVPRGGVNAFLVGDVLVDAGTRFSAKRILGELTGHPVSTHVITHAHVDHAGGTRQIAAALDIPVWVGELDAADVESGHPAAPAHNPLPDALTNAVGAFPSSHVDRRLVEGDEVGPGFVVLFTPGHSNGHISLWREADRTLICGDVINTMNLLTTKPGLQEPPKLFTTDPVRNRESIRRLAELEPQLTLAGHGPPVHGPEALRAFAASLPAG